MSAVDVIIVNWNDADNLVTALDSILALPEVKADRSFANIVVSDNGSTDDSLARVRQMYGARVVVIENGSNLGFAAGVNRAVERTTAPYIFLLNPDATAKAGALRHLVDFMELHPQCAVAGPKIYEADGSVAESCGEFDSWIGAFLRSSAWGELAPF
ncbi:MAG: glycosyltransferase, partial [Candidatus Eremiobacteraeota bacterium]|nr:glycosyltransferase [Candidatus Eremiobacteraeota bacterium]